MPDPDLAPLLDIRWPQLSHRVVQTRLRQLGWDICGVGDWAYAYRSPGGRLAARVSPFEPAYGYFVELCRRCAGNPYVPRIDLATRLEGGGHLAIMEYLGTPDSAVVKGFLRQWDQTEDGQLRALRHEVETLDQWGRGHVRWWGKVDVGDRHVLRAADGNLKVIDLFFVTWDLVQELISDPTAFARHMAPDLCRYVLDVPDLQDGTAPAEYLRRIGEALATIGAN